MVGTAINTNQLALTSSRNLSKANLGIANSISQLSSGLRINKASDDVAGSAISNRMSIEAGGLGVAVRNASEAKSLLGSAESGLSATESLLSRMNDLAIQAANATNSDADRRSIQGEVNQLLLEVNRIAETTNFNDVKILNGDLNNKQFQIGTAASDTISITIASSKTTDLGNNRINTQNATTNDGTASTTDASTSAPANNAILAQTLTLSGGLGTKAVSVGTGDSAYTIANNINDDFSEHGVEATASTEAQLSGLNKDGTVTLNIGSGGDVGVITAAVSQNDLSALASAVNDKSGATGISATYSGGTLNLIQADGKDVIISGFDHTAAGATINVAAVLSDGSVVAGAETLYSTATGFDNTTITGSIFFDSSDAFAVSSSVANTAGSILNVGADTSVASEAELLSTIDVSSAEGARAALRVIDASLLTTTENRSSIGSIDNRLTSITANLSANRDLTTAAAGNIRDADFAQQTTLLAKNQILSSAATSMLAQANQLPQQVLQLLG